MEESKEIWIPIPGFPRHEASNLGRIRGLSDKDYVFDARGWSYIRHRPEKILSVKYDSRGYGYVSINDKTYLLHRMIALAFHGYAPHAKCHVNHKNGNKKDNHSDNLEWMTASENEQHSYSVLGKQPWNKGKKSPQISRSKMGHFVSVEQIIKCKRTWAAKRLQKGV